jgi:hypothetical protein
MRRFKVLAGATVIGHSELESGDPPMGVAVGRFFPLLNYGEIQAAVIAAGDGSQSHLGLSVRSPGGVVLLAAGGVQLIDLSAELGPEAIEVHVLGIGFPLYGELFPQQVAAYARLGRPDAGA